MGDTQINFYDQRATDVQLMHFLILTKKNFFFNLREFKYLHKNLMLKKIGTDDNSNNKEIYDESL